MNNLWLFLRKFHPIYFRVKNNVWGKINGSPNEPPTLTKWTFKHKWWCFFSLGQTQRGWFMMKKGHQFTVGKNLKWELFRERSTFSEVFKFCTYHRGQILQKKLLPKCFNKSRDFPSTREECTSWGKSKKEITKIVNDIAGEQHFLQELHHVSPHSAR